MKLCAECAARQKQINAAVKRVILDGGTIEVPEGETLHMFRSMILNCAKRMNVEIATRTAETGNAIRVRHFHE